MAWIDKYSIKKFEDLFGVYNYVPPDTDSDMLACCLLVIEIVEVLLDMTVHKRNSTF